MTGQPFFFDKNIFDDENLIQKHLDDDKPSIPEFTSEQLEAAQVAAFEKGKKSGFDESQSGMHNDIILTLKRVENNFSVLFASEQERNNKYAAEAVHLTARIFSKIFPVFSRNHGLEEVKSVINKTILENQTQEKITIDINEKIRIPLEEYISTTSMKMQKQISLSSNNTLQKNECLISWPYGGVIYNQNDIAQKTLSIMKEALAEQGFSVHDIKHSDVHEETKEIESDTPSEIIEETIPSTKPDKNGEI